MARLDADLRAAVDTLIRADSEAETETTGGFLVRSPMVLESLLHGMGIELVEGPTEAGNRQFVVADPDGYLWRPFRDLGVRPAQP